MWSPWGRSSPAAHGGASHRAIFPCTSFKDVQRLYNDDDPTSPRKCEPVTRPDNENHNPNPNPNRQPTPTRKKVFHRVRAASSLIRNLSTRPEPLATIPTHKPEPPRITIAGADTRIVVYHTSIRAIRPTFEACRAVQSILAGFRVNIDERDVVMDPGFLDELQRILGVVSKEKLTLPVVFVGGCYIGGAEEVRQLNEIGELKKLIECLPAVETRVCDTCGGYRFVICGECGGSRKVYGDHKVGFRACTVCNENGLIKCPDCYPTALVRR